MNKRNHFRHMILLCLLCLITVALTACIRIEITGFGGDSGLSGNGNWFFGITEETTREPLVLVGTVWDNGSYTARQGYLSGDASPSTVLDLSQSFDLERLAEEGYRCNIEIEYTASVQGDHLYLGCQMGMGRAGSFTTVFSMGDYYLDHNETRVMTHNVINLAPSEYYGKGGACKLTWFVDGMTFLDGLNECRIYDVKLHVTFHK